MTVERRPLPAGADAVHGPPATTGDEPRNRLAEGIRQLSELLVGRPLAADDLEAAADGVATVVERLRTAAGPGKRPRQHQVPFGHPQDFFPTSPIFGYANPLAPPVDVWAAPGDDGRLELRGRAFFGYAYEGPPTCVHGGVIAEVFDELLGAVNIIGSRPAMTGTLTIRYLRPTPLLAWLDLSARQSSAAGRKVFAEGTISHQGVVTAEAEGVFIEMRPEKMLDLVNANIRQAEGDVIDAPLADFVGHGGVLLGAEGTLPAEGGAP
jgi:acyl-coenzyme A thioesterase PaaI-like protein